MELADVALARAGERTLLVAEQDALNESLRDGAAVDGHEGLAAPFALALDGAGDHFLADARFALDEDRDIGLRAAPHHARHVLHGGGAGDEVAEGHRAADLLVQPLHLFGERVHLQEVLHRHLEPFGTDRLDDEVVGAGPHRLDHRFDGALRRLHDHRQVAVLDGEAFEKLEPVHARHHQIEDDQVDGFAARLGQAIEPGLGAVGGRRFVAEPPDHVLEDAPLGGIVIDDKNS